MSMELVIILGYTLASDCRIHPILKSRLDAALTLNQKNVEYLVCGKWPPLAIEPNRCVQTTEAAKMREYLIENGIEANRVFEENQSTSTFGNAYYCYEFFLKNRPKYQEITIISNEFHKQLVRYSFDLIYGDQYPYRFKPVLDATLNIDPKSINLWKQMIRNLVVDCYPILFSKVQKGDIKHIQSIVSDPINPKFEICIKSLLNTDDALDVNEFL